MLKKNIVFLISILLLFSGRIFGYAANDFGSIASGSYNSAATWGKWNGATWVAAGSIPLKTDNVFILAGTTVTTAATGPYYCKDLTVEAGGKIYSNITTTPNVYVLVYGNILCDGTIGNGTTFDCICFGIESVCTITGAGTFDASRMVKRTGDNPISKLTISRDVNLRFASSSQTQIYNHAATAVPTPTRFDVLITAGATLTLTTNGTSFGNAGIDGFDGSGTYNGSGSFTINGTMVVSGITYLATNNTAATVTVSTTAGSNTVTTGSTASLTIGSTIVGTGVNINMFPAGTTITAILSATQFTVSNNAIMNTTSVPTTNGGSCYWQINNGGVLRTAQVMTTYLSLTPTALAGAVLTVPSTTGIVVGSAISGTGISPGSVVTAVTATTITVTPAPSASAVGSSLSFGGGNAGHMLRVAAGGKFEITGSSGFNFALTTVNCTYDIQNGSFTEYSGTGNQNVVLIPVSSCQAFGSSSNSYGNLKISGSGTKTMFVSGTYKIANDLNIVNTTGTPVLASNNQAIWMTGGHWYNYNQSGFTEGFGTVQFTGNATQTINTTGGERYYALTYDKASTSLLQFNSPVNVTFRLTWTKDGPVFLHGNRLTMESPLTTAFAGNTGFTTRYLISETNDNSSIVQWNIGTATAASAFVIPFGIPGTPDYIPFTYSVANGVTVGNLSVATYGTPASNLPWPISPYTVLNLNSTTGLLPDNRDATVDRFWEIDVTAATPPVASVTFTYAPSELPIAPFNNALLMEAQWYSKGIDKWQPAIAGQTNGTYFSTAPALNTYGAWTLAALTSPLPIKLLKFDAKRNQEVVDLSWATATEINNQYFTLERSSDAREFLPFATIAGAGNSSTTTNYAFVDRDPLPGISYYRLKQTDYDGKFTYSDPVAVRFDDSNNTFVSVGPVPAQNYLKINCFGKESFTATLIQSDGREVKEFAQIDEGTSTLDLSDVSSGSYILRVVSAHDQRYLRIIKE